MTGNVFGRLSVISEAERVGNERPRWKCVCECGAETVVDGRELRRGNTRSCGCLQIDNTKKANTKHGQNKSRTYRIWVGMLTRCRNSNGRDYRRYGGRGITVCKKWLSFSGFVSDMGFAPDSMSIDRIKNDRGYSKSNCRWASSKRQARNRSSNVILTMNGVTFCISEWSERLGFNRHLISKRLSRGWTVEKALSIPCMKQFSNNCDRNPKKKAKKK